MTEFMPFLAGFVLGVICTGIGLSVGYRLLLMLKANMEPIANPMPGDPVKPFVPPSPPPRWNPGNLLDPVTVAQQQEAVKQVRGTAERLRALMEKED
jgi:hypothetical protein